MKKENKDTRINGLVIKQDTIKLKGQVIIRSGKACNIVREPVISNGVKIGEAVKSLEWKDVNSHYISNNTICSSGYNKISTIGWDSPVVIAFGNPSIATREELSSTNLRLTKELETGKGRQPTLIPDRYNAQTLQYTFSAFFPKNTLLSNEMLTEIGLFVGEKGDASIMQKDRGWLLARKYEEFEKQPSDDVQVIWSIRIVIE